MSSAHKYEHVPHKCLQMINTEQESRVLPFLAIGAVPALYPLKAFHPSVPVEQSHKPGQVSS